MNKFLDNIFLNFFKFDTMNNNLSILLNAMLENNKEILLDKVKAS